MKDLSTGAEGAEFTQGVRDAKRRAYIQDWIARNQRVLAAGIGTGVLALPLLAQASTSDFVSLSSIHGIRSAQEQPDGSLRLTLINGQEVVLQPGDVIIGKGGEVMISQGAADMIDGLVTVDEAAVGGGMGLAAAVLGGVMLAAIAASRGSSDTDDDDPVVPDLPVVNRADVAGLVFDDVFDQAPPDGTDQITGTIGTGDGAVSTAGVLGDDGVWRFAFDPDDLAALQGEQEVSFVAGRAEVDDDGDETGEVEELGTGSTTVIVDTIPPAIDITDVAGSDNVLNAEEREAGLVVEGTSDAEDGQVVTVEVVDADGAVVATETATVEGGAWSAEIDASGLDDDTAYTVRASVVDAAGNPADTEAALQTDFTAGVSIDPVDDLTTVNTFFDLEITGGTTGVEAGREVSVTFAGNDYGPGTVDADGRWSVTVPQADIEALGEDVTEVEITASVTDAAGNAAQDDLNVPADFTAPGFAITSPADDVVRNADNAGEDLTISGVSVPGSEVVVSINGDARDAVTAAADGSWSDTIPGGDLPGDGTYEISAQGTLGGAAVAPPATLNLLIDTVAPEVTLDSPVVPGGVLNAEEQAEGITISGTASDAGASPDTLTVMVDLDGETYTTTPNADGTWSVDIPPEGLEGLADGDTVTATATAMDPAGNASAPVDATFDTDFTAPEVSVDSIGGVTEGGTLSTAELFDADGELVDTVTVSGTAVGAPDGATVTIMLAGAAIALTPTVTAEAWSADIPASDVSNALGDLDSAEISASVQDAAGNTGTGTLNIDVDLAIPTIAIDEPADGFTIGIDAFEGGLTVAGSTTGVPEGQDVSIEIVNDADASDTINATATVAADGTWTVTIPAADVQGAPDESEFTLTASVSDGSFPAPATANIALSSDVRPEITLDAIGEDGALIIDDLGDTITFSGGTRGVQAGQEVTVSVDEGEGFSDVGTATVQADGTWSLTADTNIDDSDVGSEFTFRAEVSNEAGRTATPAEQSVVGYASSNYEMFETGRDGDTITVGIFGIDEAFPDGLTAFDVQTTIDQDVVNYGGFPSAEHPDFFFILGNPDDGPGVGTMSGVVRVTAAGEVPITDFSIALAEIETVLQDGDDVVEIGMTGVSSGASQLILGSDGADTLTAGNVDAVIRGRGGDDQIDVSAAGVNTLIFEVSSAANGFDTVTGFTLGGALADRIGFAGELPDPTMQMGDANQFQVGNGGAVSDNLALLVYTNTVDTLDADGVRDALAEFEGFSEGQGARILVSDGTDAQMFGFLDQGDDPAIVVDVARFEGLDDLSGFSSANVIGFEQFNA